MTIYCANDPCEAEATMIVEETGTPLCATCAHAFAVGQTMPKKHLRPLQPQEAEKSVRYPRALYPERGSTLENGVRICAEYLQEGDVLVLSSTYNADVAAEVLRDMGYSEEEIEKLIVIDLQEG